MKPLIEPDRVQEIYNDISEVSRPKKSYFLLIGLSAIIASYGLLSNSTAIVIGAMLVAPLMGPIFGIALSLTADDRALLRYSLMAEVTGIILTLAIAFLIGLIPLKPNFSTEIIARTQPTLYDILVALASGFAGAYALVDKRISPALAGVAISTALVPPLATCGLCLSTGNWSWALGAFSLFFANLVSIEMAGAFVFSALKPVALPRGPALIFKDIFKRFAPRVVVFSMITVYMTFTLVGIIEKRQFEDKLTTTISSEVSAVYGAHVLNLQFRKESNRINVIADVVAPHEFEPIQVRKIEDTLRKKLNPNINLIIRSLVSRSADSNGPTFLQPSELENIRENIEQKKFYDTLTKIINNHIRVLPGAQLMDISRQMDDNGETVLIVIRTPRRITPEQVAAIQTDVDAAFNRPIRLVVSSLLTYYTDKETYLFNVTPTPVNVQQSLDTSYSDELSPEEVKIRSEIERILMLNIPRQVKGARLMGITCSRKNGKREVRAQVLTPRVFKPTETAVLEKIVNKMIADDIRLCIRSIIGSESTAPVPPVKTPGPRKTP